MTADRLIIRQAGLLDYEDAWQRMCRFTESRAKNTPDECWQVEHPPVYTLGLAGKAQHILAHNNIPVVQTDRGGQLTYHGPGQLVVYLMIDLKRKGLTVRRYVKKLEQMLIDFLALKNIDAARINNAPGVYVDGKKIAALGIRIKRGCSYHGVALNVDMDLTPFNSIDPCGYPGLQVTRLADLGYEQSAEAIFEELLPVLLREFDFSSMESVMDSNKSRAA